MLYNTRTVILHCPEKKKALKVCVFCVGRILFDDRYHYVPRLVDCYHLAEIFLSLTHLICENYKTSLTNLNKGIFWKFLRSQSSQHVNFGL